MSRTGSRTASGIHRIRTATVALAIVASTAGLAGAAGVTAPGARAAPATVTLRGQVLTATGIPVPGATVYGWNNVAAKTGKDGRFRIVLPRDYPRLAVVSGSGVTGRAAASLPNATQWWAQNKKWLAGSTSTIKVLRLPPVASWQVTVRGSDDEPLPGVPVTGKAIRQSSFPTEPEDYPPHDWPYAWSQTTGADGTAVLRSWQDLPPEASLLAQPTPACAAVLDLTWSSTRTADVQFPMAGWAPRQVTGRVVSAEGEPAAGARVSVTVVGTAQGGVPATPPTGPTITCTDTATADVAGLFTVAAPRAFGTRDSVTVQAPAGTGPPDWGPDASTWSVEIPARAPTTGSGARSDAVVSFALPRTVTTTLTIVDADGAKVAGAVAEVQEEPPFFNTDQGWIQDELAWPTLHADSNGQVRFRAWTREPQGITPDSSADQYVAVFQAEISATVSGRAARAVMKGGTPTADASATVRLGAPGGAARTWGVPVFPGPVTYQRIPQGLRLTWPHAVPETLPLLGYVVRNPGDGARPRLGPDVTTTTVDKPLYSPYCVLAQARDDTFGYTVAEPDEDMWVQESEDCVSLG